MDEHFNCKINQFRETEREIIGHTEHIEQDGLINSSHKKERGWGMKYKTNDH